MMKLQIPSPVQELSSSFLEDKGIRLFMKRDDLIHPDISGNKWRKLKFNLLKAQSKGSSAILTFGGAFSNHILATAAACKEAGIPAIGIIRGEQVKPLNHTLSAAQNMGMQLEFVSREEYKNKEVDWYIQELRLKYGNFHLVPEGGANFYGVSGCMEILKESELKPDIVVCAAGTGTTLTGLLLSLTSKQQLWGFPALKGGEFIQDNVSHLMNYSLYEKEDVAECMKQLKLFTQYHFGGYAKVNDQLVNFVNEFYEDYQIPLDLVYTGKMMFGLFEMIRENQIPKESTILAIHTGGLQGNQGMKERLGLALNF